MKRLLLSSAFVLSLGNLALGQTPDGEFTPPAQHEKIPEFMLMLTIHTPGRQPDQHRNLPMKSLEECWEQAHLFMDESPVPEGMIGISAGCGKSAPQGSKS